MRVISGTARGTKLKTLEGDDIIRPTTDRVKESIFNIIQFNVHGSKVLDVFCGSGALGIEALSRGATVATFVDMNNSSLKIAEENLKKTHLFDKAKIIKSDFEQFFSTNQEKYDIILADPPYKLGFLPTFLDLVAKHDALSKDGILIFETSSDVEVYENFELGAYKTANYGKTKVIFYQHRE